MSQFSFPPSDDSGHQRSAPLTPLPLMNFNSSSFDIASCSLALAFSLDLLRFSVLLAQIRRRRLSSVLRPRISFDFVCYTLVNTSCLHRCTRKIRRALFLQVDTDTLHAGSLTAAIIRTVIHEMEK
ncbi:hypothetical protein BRADI_1g61385v3 [Brachypodium distachyon]|uniref:Uncharacterized protein n=1 Tax=Brachypodium distachyon TaxID=15368 RepID=A0A2K2DSS7_BRADI|nr:hypothetical protein BRADI_1g61385v3 [Brachypodium distachyon]